MIRQLLLSEAALVADLDAACFPDNWSEKSWHNEIAAGLVFGFFTDNELVGAISFHQVLDEAELYKIMVSSINRQQGIGKKLLEYGLGELQKIGVGTLFLEVAEHNSPAIGLYKAMGFAQTGFRANYYENPPDNALLMTLDLNK